MYKALWEKAEKEHKKTRQEMESLKQHYDKERDCSRTLARSLAQKRHELREKARAAADQDTKWNIRHRVVMEELDSLRKSCVKKVNEHKGKCLGLLALLDSVGDYQKALVIGRSLYTKITYNE